MALDSRFGSLVFINANKKLSKTQKLLKEAIDLGYKELLSEGDAKNIDTYTEQLSKHLEWLRNLDIGTVPNAKAEHDTFEQTVGGYYNGIYQNVVMKYLPFLREERRRENPDEKKLEEEILKASKLRSDLEKELVAVREDIEKIRVTGKDVGSAKGARAAIRTEKHFDDEVTKHNGFVKKWFWAVAVGYTIILVILIILGFETISCLAGSYLTGDILVTKRKVMLGHAQYGVPYISCE